MAVNEKSLENLTSFAKGGDPRQSQNLEEVSKPWEISKHMRYLAAQEVDPGDPEGMQKLITVAPDGSKRIPKVAETIAAALLSRASSGHVRAADCVMDRMEGKVPLPIKHEDERKDLPPPVFNITVRETTPAVAIIPETGPKAV